MPKKVAGPEASRQAWMTEASGKLKISATYNNQRPIYPSDKANSNKYDDFDGPLKKRQCRDVIFLIIFVGYLIVLAVGIGIAVRAGNIDRIIKGTDDYGNTCGKNNSKIKDVPRSGRDFTKENLVQPTNSSVLTPNGIIQLIPELTCEKKCKEDYEAFFHRCLYTKKISSAYQDVTNKFSTSFFQEAAVDIQNSWREMVYMGLIGIALSILMTVLLRYFAPVLIWVTIIVVTLGSIAASCYLWYAYSQAKNEVANGGGKRAEDKANQFLWAAIISTIVTVVFVLLFIAMRNRIALVAALFKEAGKAIGDMPLILLQPFWTFIVLVGLIILWLYALLWIQSSGQPTVYKYSPQVNKVSFELTDFMKVIRWWHFFALIWLTYFIISCQHFVIASCVATWFFTRDKTKFSSPIIVSMARLVRYHLGSLALGSLLIAIVYVIRAIMHYIQEKIKDVTNGNAILMCLCRCCDCILYCFEKFLKFLTRNAYIEIAIYGYGFCKAASKAWRVITGNVLRVAAINHVGDFVLFLAKAGITVAVVFIGIQIMKAKGPGITYPWVPIVLSAVFVYVVAHCFMAVYEMTIDTLFVCFCEDCERNNGTDRPYYMSSSLMEFVENSKEALAIQNNNNKNK